MAYLGPSSAPSRGALLRRHRLPRYRHRLSRAMGKRPSGLGRFPGFPARAFARVESRAARLTVFPVYGLIRYRMHPSSLIIERAQRCVTLRQPYRRCTVHGVSYIHTCLSMASGQVR